MAQYEDRRHDLGKYFGNLFMAAVVGACSCLITLKVATSTLETRVTNMEQREVRLTTMIDKLDDEKVDKDTFKSVLLEIKEQIAGLREDIREAEKGRRR